MAEVPGPTEDKEHRPDDNPQVLASNGKTPADPDKPQGVASEDGGTRAVPGFGHTEES